MTATIHMLPSRVAVPCRRCGGLRRVTFDQMSEAQKASAPSGSVFPCPDCGDDAEVLPFEPVARARAATDRFEAAMHALIDALREPVIVVQLPEGKR